MTIGVGSKCGTYRALTGFGLSPTLSKSDLPFRGFGGYAFLSFTPLTDFRSKRPFGHRAKCKNHRLAKDKMAMIMRE